MLLQHKIAVDQRAFYITIVEQEYRNDSFNFNSATFKASNGMRLHSCCCTEYGGSYDFYVRGNDYECDADIIDCPSRDFNNVMRFNYAVYEYNKRRAV